MIIGDVLFWKSHLNSFLQAQAASVENHVRKHMTETDLGLSDDEIVARMLKHAKIGSLSVDFENPERSVKEHLVTLRDHFRGNVTIDGVRVMKSFHFTGHGQLFNMRPSTFDSGPPHGLIETDRVIIGYEGRNDPDSIKSSIADQESQLRKYLEWSKAEVDAHDARLPALLVAAIAKRRSALQDLKKLSDF